MSVVESFVGVKMLQSSECTICSFQSVDTLKLSRREPNRLPMTVNLYILVQEIADKSYLYYADYTKIRS